MKRVGQVSCYVAVAAVLVLALPARALAEAWVPTPYPSIAEDLATGYKGHLGGVPADWPAYDTDMYPDSVSCNEALNDASYKVGLSLYDIPASSTDEQFAFARAAAVVFAANRDALAALLPICLAKPPPNGPIDMKFAAPKPRVIETFDARYALLKLLCVGYSECTVRGKVIIDCLLGPAACVKRTIGSRSFSLASEGEKSFRVSLTRAGRELLKKRGSLKVRLTMRSNGLTGQGPSRTTQQTLTLRLKKR